MQKSLIGAITLVGVIALFGLYYPNSPAMDEEGLVNKFRAIAKDLGAMSSTVSTENCRSYAGVETCSYRQGMRSTGTTTVCALRSPTHASSTLLGFVGDVTTATSSAITVVLSRLSTPYSPSIGAATTTGLINYRDYAASTLNDFNVIATSSVPLSTVASPNWQFGPGEYAVLYAEGGQVVDNGGSGSLWAGSCTAEFRVN